MTARDLAYAASVRRALAVVVSVLAATAAADGELARLSADVPACDAARATCIGVRLHVTVTDAGPIATSAWIAAQLAEANRHFAPLDVGFEIVGVAPLPAAFARIEDRRERSALGARVGGAVIDVFITGHLDDVDTPGAMARGVTWRTGTRKFVIVSTQGPDRVLAHELGHVFGLPHSTHAISIMNKTPRDAPPIEERTFHADEYARMKPRLRALLRAQVIANRASRSRR